MVCVGAGTLWIDAVPYGPILRDSQGQSFPHLAGCLVLQAGPVFLASPAPHSLDGRSFGPTPLAALMAQAIPLWTWRSAFPTAAIPC
jgi:type IV secretory pathway protease TraF